MGTLLKGMDMKTEICGLILAGLTGAGLLAQESATDTQTTSASAPKQSIAEGENKLPLPTDSVLPRTTSTNKQASIVGKRVYDMNGTELGRVQDLVVDMEKGELGYVVLEVKTEDGPRKLPVPASALKGGEQPDALVLNISQEVLAAAEVYRDEELPTPNVFSVDGAVGAAAGSEQGSESSDDQQSGEQPKDSKEQPKE
ncbi:MAG TPA: PRC-barrel domain-containing protein [Verrucomicrobiae bacterium]